MSSDETQSHSLAHEAAPMVLYIAVILLAEMAAFPEDHEPRKLELLAVIWGTAIGLALAHWFAFRVAYRLFEHERVGVADLKVGAVHVGAAALVALAASVPVLASPKDWGTEAAGFVPAVFIGGAGYLAGRAAGRSRRWSIGLGILTFLVGLIVAGFKNLLAGH